MPAPRRQKVVGAFVFLIVVMIITNLYLLSVYAAWSFEEEQNKRIEQMKKTGMLYRPEISSIRFERHNGRIYLFTPFGLAEEEIMLVAQRIEYLLKRKGVDDRAQVSGVLRLAGRSKRALELPLVMENTLLEESDPEKMWKNVSNWPFTDTDFITQGALGQTLRFVNKAKIHRSMNPPMGAQLKIELILNGGQRAYFKPKWYPRDHVIKGDIYGGKDRHFGEIAAFYLNQLLGYENAPLTVGRKINLIHEILPYATEELKNTFYYNQSNLCFYGSCSYCKPEEPVCAEGLELEGALVLHLNHKAKQIPNPWGRSYKKGIFAPWETDKSFCQNLIMKNMTREEQDVFILDIVAVSIFDFLIGNGDRHHLEMFADKSTFTKGHSKTILLVDNGKSFGNPFEDYFDILAPLFQCCKIRSNLWTTLKKFHSNLGNSMDSITKFDPLYPLLTQDHLSALDSRLEIIYATVQFCLEIAKSPENVIV